MSCAVLFRHRCVLKSNLLDGIDHKVTACLSRSIVRGTDTSRVTLAYIHGFRLDPQA